MSEKIKPESSVHVPVLLHEVIEGLNPTKGESVLDATLGGGGHSEELIKLIGKDGVFVGIDQNEDAIELVGKRLKSLGGKINLINGNFRNLSDSLEKAGINKVDKILFDLGISSDHLETSGRGFTFRKDEPLLMTLGKTANIFTARDIVNEWDEENIREIISSYGEEKFAAKIARAIVTARMSSPIEKTSDLTRIIELAVPAFYKNRKIHPATKTFQALRIAVNDELKALEGGLEEAIEALNKGGRVAVISFHSLEDRIVKNFFKKKMADGEIKILTKRPITPTDEEIKNNPRSRSAKLRIAEKIK